MHRPTHPPANGQRSIDVGSVATADNILSGPSPCYSTFPRRRKGRRMDAEIPQRSGAATEGGGTTKYTKYTKGEALGSCR
jgi:hypothetical protein